MKSSSGLIIRIIKKILKLH